MVAHVVVLKPRADLPAEERRAFVKAFERATREITSVRTVQIGSRVIHGAAYELVMPDAADFVAIIEFDDVAGLQAYLGHPAHEELGRLFGLSLSSALVYDFEVGGMEMLWKDDL
jgi:stress responsive alpha/beta barrel protein